MNRYLTTTLPYVNGDPHIGFALEIIQADVLVRTWRSQGDAVFFSTGTDEHGQKIFEAAEKAGKDVKDYVDHYAAEFQKLKEALALSNDHFIRTTDAGHIEAAQEMWRRCDAAGDIEKRTYTGLYCVGCEAFKTERELTEDGTHCLIHPHAGLQELSETNYFFKLSKYQDVLLEYLGRPGVISPEWRRDEAVNFVREGLQDFSISREKERLSWGIPVPGDDTQVLYVWFDALTNYLSTLGWPTDMKKFSEFWEAADTYQFAGKDQVRFQSIMWQAMLFSAGIKNTDHIHYHGFINSGGVKMSKSLGNVISPYDLVAKYGADATRYLLTRHVHPVDDSDITWERLDEWYTAHLVNGVGNLTSRIMKLAEDHLSEAVEVTEGALAFDKEFVTRIESFHFNEALDYVFEMIQESDGVMTERAPFRKVKSEAEDIREEGKEDLRLLIGHLIRIAAHLAPVMPQTSEAILSAIRQNKKPDNLFPRLLEK